MREEAEKKQKEYQEQLESMKHETEMRRKELHQAQSTIALLEQQLRELREAKDKLEMKQTELEAIMRQLEDTKNTETAERLRLEQEIREKQEEVDRIRTEVTERDEAARKLQVGTVYSLIIVSWMFYFHTIPNTLLVQSSSEVHSMEHGLMGEFVWQ